jgi:hypothetical protein
VETALERHDLEPSGGDPGGGVPGRLAAAQRPGPEEPIGGALEGPEESARRAHMLVEAELAARPQHTAKLAERGAGLGNAAQDPDQHRRVERRVLGRKRRRVAVHHLDRNRGVARPPGCDLPRDGIGLDGQHTLDAGSIQLEPVAVAAAELEDLSAEPREHAASEPARHAIGAAFLPLLEVPRDCRGP